MKSAAHSQAGVEGNQSVMIMAAPVNSLPSATVHVSQYRMAVTKPVAGPRQRRAYTWNAPVRGMATLSSPRHSMTRYTMADPTA